jgi:site-specific recombinase XerD
MLYCCGLRPAEVRKLRMKNVDNASGKIFVMATKKHTDRVVMMADDLADYCGSMTAGLSAFCLSENFSLPNLTAVHTHIVGLL